MRSLNIPKRIIAALLSAAVLISMIAPVGAFAEEQEQKTIRVGWFDSSFCYFDKFGRRYRPVE